MLQQECLFRLANIFPAVDQLTKLVVVPTDLPCRMRLLQLGAHRLDIIGTQNARIVPRTGAQFLFRVGKIKARLAVADKIAPWPFIALRHRNPFNQAVIALLRRLIKFAVNDPLFGNPIRFQRRAHLGRQGFVVLFNIVLQQIDRLVGYRIILPIRLDQVLHLMRMIHPQRHLGTLHTHRTQHQCYHRFHSILPFALLIVALQKQLTNCDQTHCLFPAVLSIFFAPFSSAEPSAQPNI